MSDPVDLMPDACPCCGGKAWFRYTNKSEAKRGSPLCWGANETDCPGWEKFVARQDKP